MDKETALANLGRQFATHLVLEKILGHVFGGQPEALAEMESACLATVDAMPVEWFSGQRRIILDHMAGSVEAIFAAARNPDPSAATAGSVGEDR